MKFPILNLRDEINAELEGAIGFWALRMKEEAELV